MSSKFLESDVVDSKIFAGRVLSLLGEVLANLHAQQEFLEDRFHVPSEYPGKDSDRGSEEDSEEWDDES